MHEGTAFFKDFDRILALYWKEFRHVNFKWGIDSSAGVFTNDNKIKQDVELGYLHFLFSNLFSLIFVNEIV